MDFHPLAALPHVIEVELEILFLLDHSGSISAMGALIAREVFFSARPLASTE